MKALIAAILFTGGFSVHAKTFNVRNDEALRLVEAMVWTGSVFSDAGTNLKTESTTQPTVCRYAANADGIVNEAHCYIGTTGIGGGFPPEFSKESLAFFQAIRNYGKEVNLMSFPAIQVDNVTCTMRISPRKYTCTVMVN